MIQALWNVFAVMVMYTLSRLFFYLTHLGIYADVSASHLMEMLGGGVRFDLTAVLYLSSVYLLMAVAPLPAKWRENRVYATIQKWTFLVFNWLGLLINSADIIYFDFTNRRTTCSFFTEFKNEGNLFTIFIESAVQYWYVTLFAAAMCVGLLFLYKPYKRLYREGQTSTLPKISILYKTKVYYPVTAGLFVVGMYFTVIGMRGGFGSYTRPITISNAAQYVNRPIENAIVLNTPFCLMKSLGSTTYENPHYFADSELESVMTPVHNEKSKGIFDSKPNVVIFILESFGAEHIGFYNPSSKAYTPFLDSLMQHSIVYEHAYSCGRKSIDACPAVFSSIPMLYEPYVLSSYSTDEVSSVADVLNREGYSTSFFHGVPNGSMGFMAYTKSIKFSRYYGMDEYMDDPETDHNAFDGTWAIWDEEFLGYYSRTLGRMKEPFLSAVFTASSHHPFAVPERYKGKLPEGPKPLCKCIAYSDNALRGFFNYAKHQPWFDRTIFVLVADHTNEQILPEYLTDEGLFRIPIVFYIPALEKSDTRRIEYPRVDSTTIASQVDIFPSIMALVGCEQPFFSFGQNIVTEPKRHNYAINYQEPYFQVISKDGMIQFDGKNIVNIYGKIPQEEQEEMVRYLKGYIQQYVTRLIGNRMTCK